MKFSCSKKELSETINNVLPAVSSKSSLTSLEGFLMKVSENILTITGYNLELGIIKKIEIENGSDGQIILNASLLANIINKMPDGEVFFSSDEKLLTVIKCGEAEFTILGMDAEEYPDMPIISDEKEINISKELLKNMISQTLFCVAQSDQNPTLTGSLFNIKDGMLFIVSVDGVRLALRKEKINEADNFQFIVPGKTLAEILKLLSRFSTEDGEEENTKISVSSKHISININGYILISRLLEGEFLDYENAIPKENSTTVIIDTKEFLSSINRASIIINERAKSPIKCTFSEENVKIFCETPIGKINDIVKAEIEGPEVKIGFNNKYMADALKASESEKLKIQINGPISPIKIVPVDDEDFLFLVLPIRLKS